MIMSIYSKIKKAVVDTVDAVVDKTSIQAKKSRLLTVMKNEKLLTNQAYIELGRYYYNNLRENSPEYVEEICDRIDSSKERMSRAQEKYREVLREELVNKEITKDEVKENIQKIKDPIVNKAKDTANKVSEFKDAAIEKATEKATELKEKLPKQKVEVGYGEIEDDNDEVAEEACDCSLETEIEKAIESDNDVAIQEAIEKAVQEELSKPLSDIPEDILVYNDDGPIVDIDDDDDILYSNSMYGTNKKSKETESSEIYSFSSNKKVSEVASDDESFVPNTEPVDQEFQRNMPVDIISEDEFEENEPEVKSIPKTAPRFKASKLKRIIKNQEDE